MHILATTFVQHFLDFLRTSDKFQTLIPLPGASFKFVFERK